jgi:(2Fe-2S) ferredoxin
MPEPEHQAPAVRYQAPSAQTRDQGRAKTEAIGVSRGQTHFFLCVGPDCCDPQFGLSVWGYLKRRIKELEPQLGGPRILRTKVGCLRICDDLGPTLVVYPSGRWYHALDPANCERVLQYELFGHGRIEDLLLARSGEAL